KLAYMCGDLGCNMSFALNSYLMLFWTQYMGLSLTTWGIIILLLKIWDAINDPIIGGLIDAIRPKPGQSKFKPWIFWGSLALIFSGAVCFIPIKEASMPIKIIICVVGYLLWDLSYTIVNVPYGSLNAAITSDATERSSLSTFRSIGAFIANILLAVLIPLLIYNEAGDIIGQILIIVGLVCGVFGFIFFQILCHGTTERVVIDYDAQIKKEKFNYFKSIKAFFTNRSAVSFTVVTIFQLLAFSFMATCSTLFIQQSFPEYTKLSGIVSMLGFLPTIIFIPFVGKLVKKFGKKEASTWPMLLGVVAGILLLVLPVENFTGIVGIALWLLPSILLGLSIGVNSLVCWAMVADCIDYHEIKTGKREEGVVYATYSLGRKLAQGFGASLVSFLLIFTGYLPELGAEQAAGVNTNIRILLGIVYIVSFLVQFLLLLFVYNLSKKKVAEMVHTLGRENTVDNSKAIED
ncbi:MAG: glycoside-pentoside-hexuronide (GPH):cation symporter, partial [Bacilli bacterium]|nr:glycoside-pentoside-hexuronide (GPH):cation symporter [Bacilli bacterium]